MPGLRIQEQFLETAGKYGLIKKKDSLMLGVSGGPDSIALLYLFYEIRREYRLNLFCVHFNHLLRPEADEEERFVKAAAEELKIPFISERKDVGSFFEGDSLEQTARNLRYDFFCKISRQIRVKKIALAHHRDDLVETVVMRFIRGSGLRGLRGFLPRTKYKQLTVIRPLIETPKQLLLNWLEERKIAYCVDKSNFEDVFLRNKIRLKLLPLLEKLNPNSPDVIANLAHTLSLDYDFIEQESKNIYQSLRRSQSPKSVSLDIGLLRDLHPALFNNVIRFAIEDLKGNVRRIERKHLREIEDLVFSRPRGSVVHLPFLAVKKDEKHLVIQTLIS